MLGEWMEEQRGLIGMSIGKDSSILYKMKRSDAPKVYPVNKS